MTSCSSKCRTVLSSCIMFACSDCLNQPPCQPTVLVVVAAAALMQMSPATLHRPPPWHPPADPSVAPPTQRYMPLRRTRATTCGPHTRAQGDLHVHPGVLVPRELGAPAGHFSEISDLNSDFEDRNAFGAIIRANCATYV